MASQHDHIARLLSTILPDETVIGDPYWAIMAWADDHLTGELWTIPRGSQIIVPLFSSHNDATNVHHNIPEGHRYVVRGLSRNHLQFSVQRLKEGSQFAVVEELYPNGQFSLRLLTKEELVSKRP
ncbi:MAG: hypothetical protein ACYCT0_01030 [Sulfobacillus sp.]